MRLFYLFFVLISSQLLLNGNAYAITCTSTGNGNWASGGTWSCGRKPNCGDTVYINHTVTIAATEDYFACGSPMFIVINSGGTMHFNNGRKLKLPCGSGVTLESGSPNGAITANGYTGNSESLQICVANPPVWQASNGPASGPTVFGSGLPIELISFNAGLNYDEVHLTWTTASETNNHYFAIERSPNGKEWENIIQTNGAGNSNSIINYFEIDHSPLVGNNYYRLKQVDYDGRFSYSQIVLVKTYNQLLGEFTLYPNPNDGSFYLQLSSFGEEDYSIVIRDISGRECFTKAIVPTSDSHIEAINLSEQLAAGTYIITASSPTELHSQKLIVK